MIPQLIIIEGADCSGKSTLAKTINNLVKGSFYWHLTRTPALDAGMVSYYDNQIQNLGYALDIGFVVILDRFWISEMIYSSVMRQEYMERSLELWPRYEAWVQRYGGRYVFCDDSGVAERHFKQIDQAHPYDRKVFGKIIEGYRQFFDAMHEDRFVRYNLNVHGSMIATWMEALDEDR